MSHCNCDNCVFTRKHGGYMPHSHSKPLEPPPGHAVLEPGRKYGLWTMNKFKVFGYVALAYFIGHAIGRLV